ncbi:hypothetical protein [Paenisporosarcina indica]|nr:hypothetical protein [Paenisporosarcina indica]
MFAIVRNELFMGNKREVIIRENKSEVQIERIDMLRTSNDLKTTHLKRE